MCECEECCYYWQEDFEEYPHCHWCDRYPDDKPPCEYDEYDYTFDHDDECEVW